MAIALATLVVTIAFWTMAYGLAVGTAGTPSGEGGQPETIALGSVALSLVAIPIAFMVAGFVSRKRDWPIAVLAGMGLAIAVGLPLLVFRNPLAALLAGLAAGAVVSLSRPEGMPWHNRAIAAAIVTMVAIAGLEVQALFLPVAAIGPALPFTAMGVADLFGPRHEGTGD